MKNDTTEKKIIPMLNDSTTLIGKGSFGSVYLSSTGWVYKETKICLPIKTNGENDFVLNENNIKEIIFYKILLNKLVSYTKHHLFPYLQYFPSSIMFPIKLLISNHQCRIHMKHAGTPLHKYKNKGQSQLNRTFTSLVKTVYFLYSCGITHGDIKPNNILISSDGKSTLVDYGSICFNHTLPVHNPFQRCTIFYVSPEELQDDSYSIMNDWWSLGVVFFESITDKCFIKCLLKTCNVEKRLIDMFLDYAYQLKCNPLFNPNQFLIYFFNSITQHDIQRLLNKYTSHTLYHTILSKLLSISPEERKQGIPSVLQFFQVSPYNLSVEEQISESIPLLPFHKLEVTTITKSQRNESVQKMYEICSGLFSLPLFGHSVMLFDRFYFRLVNYSFPNIYHGCVSVIVCYLSSLILKGEVCYGSQIQSLIKDYFKKEYTIEQILDTLDCIFIVLDYQLYNVSPDMVIKEYTDRMLTIYTKFPVINANIEGLIHELRGLPV